jgi:hypothetical protein
MVSFLLRSNALQNLSPAAGSVCGASRVVGRGLLLGGGEAPMPIAVGSVGFRVWHGVCVSGCARNCGGSVLCARWPVSEVGTQGPVGGPSPLVGLVEPTGSDVSEAL